MLSELIIKTITCTWNPHEKDFRSKRSIVENTATTHVLNVTIIQGIVTIKS